MYINGLWRCNYVVNMYVSQEGMKERNVQKEKGT
jgi:hypothetical protein